MRSLFLVAFWISGVLLVAANLDSDTSEAETTALDARAVEYPTAERQQKARSSVGGEQEDRRGVSVKGLLGKGFLGRLFNRVRRVKVEFGGRRANGVKYHEIEEDLLYQKLNYFITMADRTLRNKGRVFPENRRSLKQQVVSFISRLTFSAKIPITARHAYGKIYDPSPEAIETYRTIEDFFGPAHTAFMILHGKRSSKSRKVAVRMEVLQIRKWIVDEMTPQELTEKFTASLPSVLGSKKTAKRIVAMYTPLYKAFVRKS